MVCSWVGFDPGRGVHGMSEGDLGGYGDVWLRRVSARLLAAMEGPLAAEPKLHFSRRCGQRVLRSAAGLVHFRAVGPSAQHGPLCICQTHPRLLR